MECKQLTANQLAQRPGWTRELVVFVMLKANRKLDKRYNYANLYNLDRVEAAEAKGLEEIRVEYEADQRRKAERKQQLQDAKRQRINNLSAPTPAIMQAIERAHSKEPRTLVQRAFGGSDGKFTSQVYKGIESANEAGRRRPLQHLLGPLQLQDLQPA
jgi:hypothetical protein